MLGCASAKLFFTPTLTSAASAHRNRFYLTLRWLPGPPASVVIKRQTPPPL